MSMFAIKPFLGAVVATVCVYVQLTDQCCCWRASWRWGGGSASASAPEAASTGVWWPLMDVNFILCNTVASVDSAAAVL